jgi:hypothetical protein
MTAPRQDDEGDTAAPDEASPRRRRRDVAASEDASFEGDVAWRDLRARPATDGVPQPPSRPAARSLVRLVFSPTGRLIAASAFAVSAVMLLLVSVTPGAWRGVLTGTPVAPSGAGVAPSGAGVAPSGANVARETPAAPAKIAPPPAPVVQPVLQPALQRALQPVLQPAAPPPAVTDVPAPRHERDEIAALYRRGELLVQQGNIAAARLLFARAAEAGDARSALALGATYDPDALRTHGAVGVVPNVALAREWYAKAASLGSTEAAQRIELLARGR